MKHFSEMWKTSGKCFTDLSSQTLKPLNYLRLMCLLKLSSIKNVLHVICQAYSHREFIDSSVLVDDVEHSVVIGEVRFIVHCPSE